MRTVQPLHTVTVNRLGVKPVETTVDEYTAAAVIVATGALMLLDYTDDVRILTKSSFEADETLRERVAEAKISTDGSFVALDTAGGTGLAEMLGVPVDGDHIVTDPDQSTPVDRVCAAGDVTGSHQQIATSVGECAHAAINLLEELRGPDYINYKKLEPQPV